ncbi:achaete-scute homolog 5-like [Electrophorus electricus]|uniref:BHLH domain-containing protein n=1 Tax=Electrophorus electricus TaxID=8005 RepID=A0A4W4G9M9_ELEEL|nr:achaete-scute homolog 5-like [Electrophorus electricus]
MDATFSYPFTGRYCNLRKSNVHYAVSPSGGHKESRIHAQLHPEHLSHSLPLLLYPGRVEPGFYDSSYRSAPSLLPYLGPFHGRFGVYECPFEPAFIQKRNERERQRVKCVNQGYAKLRDHLPGGTTEKRMSKVETLRAAIRYIKYLQLLVEGRVSEGERECEGLQDTDYTAAHNEELSPSSLSGTSSPTLHIEASWGSSGS